MKFLPSFGDRTERKTAEIERASGLNKQKFGRAYTPASTITDVEKAVRESYDRTTWVFRCVQAIATNQARLPLIVRQDDPMRGALIENHPLLPLLNYRPNMLESAAQFRARLSAQLLLSPRGAFIEMVPDRAGNVMAMHLLPPHKTSAIPDPDTFVAYYEVIVGQTKMRVEPENVLWLRNPHPLDPYRSMTPIEAAGIAIDTDYLARLYNATFLKNDGRPGGLISIKGNLLPDDADELKSYFTGGAGKAGEWRVIEADGLDIADMATTPRDAQYVEMRSITKEEILLAFGATETVLGNASGQTFANADAEREVFWQETMLGHLDLVASAFDQADGDPTTFVAFDLAGVEALQRAEQTRREELRMEFAAGLITADEYREATGREPFGEAGTTSLFIGSSVLPYAGGMAGAVAPSNSEAQSTSGTQSATDASTPELQAASATPADVKEVAAIEGGRFPDEAKADPPPPLIPAAAARRTGLTRTERRYLADLYLDRQEKIVVTELRRFFDRQASVTLARLGGPKVRKGTWLDRYEPTAKEVDVRRLFDPFKWNRELRDIMMPVLEDVYREAGQGMFDTFNPARPGVPAPIFNVQTPNVRAALERRLARLDGVNGATLDRLTRTLDQGQQAGEGFNDLAARVQQVFDDASRTRAMTIARTEVAGSVNEGQLIAARDGGVVKGKEWNASGDDRVRPSHEDMDGVIIPIDDLFDVDGTMMDGPGDPAGGDESVNCRCVLNFVVDLDNPDTFLGDLLGS